MQVQKAMSYSPKKIAVIGSGIIGLTSAVVAQRAGAEVTIYDPGGKLLCQAGQSITATGVIQQITNDQGDPTGETRIVTSNYSCK